MKYRKRIYVIPLEYVFSLLAFFDVYPTIEEATLRLIARVICIDEELGPG